MKTSRRLLFTAVLLVIAVAGCATTPKKIEGLKVVETRVVDGKVVYILEGDQAALARSVAQLREATKDAQIDPLKASGK